MARARATPPSLPPSPQDSEWHRVGTAVEVNVKALKKVGEKAPQSTKQAWQPATNTKGAASWANAKVRGVPAMVLTERALSGTARPRASDRVAVYVADNSGYDLERGGSAKTIRLVPLKMQGSRRGGDADDLEGEDESSFLELGEGILPPIVNPYFYPWGVVAPFTCARPPPSWRPRPTRPRLVSCS